MNGKTLEESLREATELLVEEVRFLLKEGPNLIDSQFGDNRNYSSKESADSRRSASNELSSDDDYITKLVEQIVENSTVVSLNRTKSRLPGRSVILYGGAMTCLFTLIYK